MLLKIPFETCEPLFIRFALSDESRAEVQDTDTPADAIAKLNGGAHTIDLLNFFAFSLPPREGICWAVACYRALRISPTEPEQQVLDLAERWVKDPQESVRIRLMEIAETLPSETALHWLCNAVAWNGSGSMGPVDGPVVMPHQGLHASALLGAVALLVDPEKGDFETLRTTAHEIGNHVAGGAWPLRSMEDA